MKKQIALDISAIEPGFKEHAQRGIGRYVNEINKYFALHKSDNGLTILPFTHRNIEENAPRSLQWVASVGKLSPIGRTTFRQQFVLPFLINRGNSRSHPEAKSRGATFLEGQYFDFIHFPAHMDAPAWGIKKYILTVLDLIPRVCKDLYRPHPLSPRYHFARWLEKKAIEKASLILAISETTAKDLNQYLGIPRERIIVAHLGVDEKFFEAREAVNFEEVRHKFKLPSQSQLVLYVGGIDPRKNYPMLLKGFKLLLQRMREARKPEPVLVMVGNINTDKEYTSFQELVRKEGLEGHVHELGFVDDKDLLDIYKISSVFFFPSLYEGFGLPPLEALATGLPVVSSNTSSLPEVLGNAAIMVDPKNVEEASEALFRVLNNPGYAEEAKSKGPQRARLFTWEKTGAKTLEAYHKLLST